MMGKAPDGLDADLVPAWKMMDEHDGRKRPRPFRRSKIGVFGLVSVALIEHFFAYEIAIHDVSHLSFFRCL
jgi:hypothetical protein